MVCMSLRAHGDARHVDAAVAHGHHGQVFLGRRLAAGRELGHRAARRGFRHLAAGVGVDLGIQHQDVDVAAGRQHVVQSAVADVVSPAVAADDPDALLDQRVGHGSAGRAASRVFDCLPALASSSSTRARCSKMPASVDLVGVQKRLRQVLADRRGRAAPTSSRAYSFCLSTASRMPSPNSALSSNSELDQAGPRPSSFTQ